MKAVIFRIKLLLPLILFAACLDRSDNRPSGESEPVRLRLAEFNMEDIRTTDLLNPEHPRLRQAAAIIQTLRPDIIMLSEVAYDYEGVAGFDTTQGEGANGGRFVQGFLSVSQAAGTEPVKYQFFSAPTNTGVSSGMDLDNSGAAVLNFPEPQRSNKQGDAPRQTAEERAYGNDSWGFGAFPGEYGMLLLVRPGIEILRNEVRTFQKFRWSRMPGALIPADSTGKRWYDEDEWSRLRLSSKSHWDVPVRLENGSVVHLLLSHPTPPAFDGPEGRNKKRNHDEIRFWGDYLSGSDYFEDDRGRPGPLAEDASFVIMGDLNSDLDEGSSINNPVERFITSNPRVNGAFVPLADSTGASLYERLDIDDTAQWGLRVDYVLPSTDMNVLGGGVYRPAGYIVSDHFPVWVDVEVGGGD